MSEPRKYLKYFSSKQVVIGAIGFLLTAKLQIGFILLITLLAGLALGSDVAVFGPLALVGSIVLSAFFLFIAYYLGRKDRKGKEV